MLSHLALAVAIQVFTVWLLRSWFAGAFAASAWSISREVTQAEYRWIEWFGEGRRANMSWWGSTDPRVWHLDAMLDWVVPCVAVFAVATIMTERRRPKSNSHHSA